MSQDRTKLSIEDRIKRNIEDCIGSKASSDTFDRSNKFPPSMAWISGIYAHLRAIYEIESDLVNETKRTNELLSTLLGVEGKVPTEELNDRAAIIGSLINRLRNEEGRP